MTLSELKDSRALWRGRVHEYALALETARHTGHKDHHLTRAEIDRINKARRLLAHARGMVTRRDNQIAAHTARPTNTFAGSPVPGQRPVRATHQTAGLPGFPAVDYFAKAGTPCVAPADGTVSKLSGHEPANGPVGGVHGPFGWSVYIKARDGKTYYLTHMGSRTVHVGDDVRQGHKIGTVGNYAKWGGTDHIHQGVNG